MEMNPAVYYHLVGHYISDGNGISPAELANAAMLLAETGQGESWMQRALYWKLHENVGLLERNHGG